MRQRTHSHKRHGLLQEQPRVPNSPRVSIPPPLPAARKRGQRGEAARLTDSGQHGSHGLGGQAPRAACTDKGTGCRA